MATSKVVLTTSKIWILEDTLSSSEQEPTDQSLRCCVLKWRQGKLWVKVAEANQISHIPALQNAQWLENCLKHSLVDVVCLDPKLGVTAVEYWANACEKAGKRVYLRLRGRLGSPRSLQTQQTNKRVAWVGQGVDRVLAGVLLLLLSPILLGLWLLLRLSSSQPVFGSEWWVGAQGQLFRITQFRDGRDETNAAFFLFAHRWIKTLRLNQFLLLINVLNGEMQLVGWQFYSLRETIQNQDQFHDLCKPPGIIQGRFSLMKTNILG
jgi:hypothetical protein